MSDRHIIREWDGEENAAMANKKIYNKKDNLTAQLNHVKLRMFGSEACPTALLWRGKHNSAFYATSQTSHLRYTHSSY